MSHEGDIQNTDDLYSCEDDASIVIDNSTPSESPYPLTIEINDSEKLAQIGYSQFSLNNHKIPKLTTKKNYNTEEFRIKEVVRNLSRIQFKESDENGKVSIWGITKFKGDFYRVIKDKPFPYFLGSEQKAKDAINDFFGSNNEELKQFFWLNAFPDGLLGNAKSNLVKIFSDHQVDTRTDLPEYHDIFRFEKKTEDNEVVFTYTECVNLQISDPLLDSDVQTSTPNVTFITETTLRMRPNEHFSKTPDTAIIFADDPDAESLIKKYLESKSKSLPSHRRKLNFNLRDYLINFADKYELNITAISPHIIISCENISDIIREIRASLSNEGSQPKILAINECLKILDLYNQYQQNDINTASYLYELQNFNDTYNKPSLLENILGFFGIKTENYKNYQQVQKGISQTRKEWLKNKNESVSTGKSTYSPSTKNQYCKKMGSSYLKIFQSTNDKAAFDAAKFYLGNIDEKDNPAENITNQKQSSSASFTSDMEKVIRQENKSAQTSGLAQLSFLVGLGATGWEDDEAEQVDNKPSITPVPIGSTP